MQCFIFNVGIKNERRISSPGFSPEVQRNISKSIQASKINFASPTPNMSNISSSKCSIPASRYYFFFFKMYLVLIVL